jgi:hypothetical protein
MTTYETDLLLDLVGRKHDLLCQLQELGEKQHELIGAGDISQLLTLLVSKQRLLTQMHATEKQLNPFRGQLAETRRWRSEALRQRCAELLAKCDELLGQIVEREKHSESCLRQRRDEAAERLQGAHSAGKARSAYTTPNQSRASRLDLTSEK